jgi:hypothetical protein
LGLFRLVVSDLDQVDAQRIAGVAGRVVSQWRKEANQLGIRKAECMRMESAFAQPTLKWCLASLMYSSSVIATLATCLHLPMLIPA